MIALTALLGALAGAATFFVTPRTYASKVDFYVSTPQTEGTSLQSAGQFAQSRVNSYIVLLSSEQLARRVIRVTGLPLTPAEVAAKITASTELNTVFFTATVQDSAPDRAVKIAQGVSTSFVQLVNDLDNQGRRDGAIVVLNVVSGPTVPTAPISPDWKKHIGLGVLAGLVAGLALAVLRELLDSSVRSTESAQRLTGAPVIGTIPHDPAAKRSPLIVGPTASSMRAEAYRQLRTNLQFLSATRSADVIMVTSSVPYEGKSVTAVNLALTFAEFGESVLLVDGDLRRPRAAAYLGLGNTVGLSNVLAGQAALADVIQTWGDRGLSVLASGSAPPNPSELLGSDQMHEVVQFVRGQFDKVVIDTPPVGPVTDAVVASSFADAVVIVIRHGRTSRPQLSAAAAALQQVDARVAGCVFSMKKATKAERRAYGAEEYYADDRRSVGRARTPQHAVQEPA